MGTGGRGAGLARTYYSSAPRRRPGAARSPTSISRDRSTLHVLLPPRALRAVHARHTGPRPGRGPRAARARPRLDPGLPAPPPHLHAGGLPRRAGLDEPRGHAGRGGGAPPRLPPHRLEPARAGAVDARRRRPDGQRLRAGAADRRAVGPSSRRGVLKRRLRSARVEELDNPTARGGVVQLLTPWERPPAGARA